MSNQDVHRRDGDLAVIWAREYGPGSVLDHGLRHRRNV
jgi:hypothetical protein